MSAIVLVSCVKSKRQHASTARDMYTSPLFRKMVAYADTLKPREIFILSAKYGLLSTDTVIDPYEKTLKNMSSAERQEWAKDVLARLREHCDLEQDEFVLLAGLPYRTGLVPHLRHYSIPMEGLSFGRQLQWLDHHLP